MKQAQNNFLNWPLMENNVTEEDRRAVIEFLKKNPRLTQSAQVRAFEEVWSKWMDVRYSVFVNSGSSANLISLSVLRELYGTGEVLVPVLTWVSDIASVIQCGFKPVFADIHPFTLGIDEREMEKKISAATKAIFLTHILGYNALMDRMLGILEEKKIALIEPMNPNWKDLYDELVKGEKQSFLFLTSPKMSLRAERSNLFHGKDCFVGVASSQ